jgi:glutaredoxin
MQTPGRGSSFALFEAQTQSTRIPVDLSAIIRNRMKIAFRVFASLTIALSVATATLGQTVYKSVGPDGVTVYSDHPPANGKIEKTFTFVELPSSPVPAQQLANTARTPIATSPRPDADVVLYAASWCGYCKRAKSYLAKRQIPFREIDIESPQGRSWFAQLGGRGVPLLLSRGRTMRGFSAEGYDAFFAYR